MQFAVDDAEAGHFAGGLAVERIELGGGVEELAAGRESEPVDVGDFGGDAGRSELGGGRAPVEGEDAVGRVGADEDALAAGCGERRRCGGGKSGGGGGHQKVPAREVFHGREIVADGAPAAPAACGHLRWGGRSLFARRRFVVSRPAG